MTKEKRDIQFRFVVVGLMVFYAVLVAAVSPSELVEMKGVIFFTQKTSQTDFMFHRIFQISRMARPIL